MDDLYYDVEPQFAIAFVTTFGIVSIEGWLGFNHVVIKANGHKMCGNFPFVQKIYIIIIY
jgi:hypothetical protein